MKSNKCFFMIFAGLLALFFGNKPAFCTTYYVPDDYPTIQAAVNATWGGETIIVRAGTYTGVGNRNILINKIITVKSEEGPENTIIDCQKAGRGFIFSNVSTPVLEGFQIINGSAIYGGGIYCSYASPLITNCMINENTSTYYGGGMYFTNSNPEIRDCQINENTATSYGGGMYLANSNPEIRDCQINENTTSYGGGMYLANSNPEIRDCQINENTATSYGGGMYVASFNSLNINDCQIIKNNAPTGGGGIYATNDRASANPFLLTNCAIISNSAGFSAYGGGVYISSSSLSYIKPIITNCTFAWNYAGLGAGIYSYSSTTKICNSIFYNGALVEIYMPSSASNSVTYSNIFGGYTGEGNISENPQFVANGDFHLSASSPCIDKASSEDAPDTDIDNELRPQGAGYDMGADEFDGIPAPPPQSPSKADLNEDGMVDGLDVSIFATEFGKID